MHLFYAPAFCLVFLFTIIPFYPLKAQTTSEIRFKPRYDYVMGGMNLVWTGANFAYQSQHKQIPATFLNSEIPGLDQFHRYRLNKTTARVSDVTAILTGIAAGLTISTQPRKVWAVKSMVAAQSVWLTLNMTQTVKMMTLRARPYTHAPGFTPSKMDDYYSFFSGHSAAVASLATSAWLMRERQGIGASPGQKIIPISCSVLAATTALLRILAGKHYPSDVLTGITTGMGIAYINYKIHAL